MVFLGELPAIIRTLTKRAFHRLSKVQSLSFRPSRCTRVKFMSAFIQITYLLVLNFKQNCIKFDFVHWYRRHFETILVSTV